MSATLTTQVLKVTNGVCGVIHTATTGRTLCGRDAAGMLVLTGMGPWESMGWQAASKGPCVRCAAKLAKIPAAAPVAPITIDSTPAGIYAAMMRANASESAAPQSRLYGLLSDYLRRTLVTAYGIDADAVYDAVISSGECTDDVIEDTLADTAYMRGQRGGRNYFVTAPSAIEYELRHVLQISRDWRYGMTEFATIGQHGSGYWTVTQGRTVSGQPMLYTDEQMTLTCVTRFADSRQAQAAVRAAHYS